MRHLPGMPAVVGVFLLMAAVSGVRSSAVAQGYPEKPVMLVVPWPAGGSTDVIMRAIAESAAKHLGQPIVVDNKPGGNGTLGPAVMAASAKSDGYTIAQIPSSVWRLPLMQKMTYDALKDFTYIVQLTGYTFGITTRADGPFKSWQEVVAFAKANPGKVTYASPGASSLSAWSRSQPILGFSSPTCLSRAVPRRTPLCSAGTLCCRPTPAAGNRWSMPGNCACLRSGLRSAARIGPMHCDRDDGKVRHGPALPGHDCLS